MSIHNNFHRLNFEKSKQRLQMTMQNEHADSKQMQIKRRNAHVDFQHEMIDWLLQTQIHKSKQY
jgi:hypothetical protein